MNLGLNLVSYIYNEQRKEYAERSFASLVKTKLDLKDKVFGMYFTYKVSNITFDYKSWIFKFPFSRTLTAEQPEWINGLDPVVIWTTDQMFRHHPEVTHVCLLTDDVLYNPDWLTALIMLIERRPNAKAWSVYRSSYTRHHRTVKTQGWMYLPGPGGTDIQVTSIAGIGTVSRREWEEYAPNWRLGHGGFAVPEHLGGGNTVDLHHAYARPGERWTTENSYWQHIGAVGTHGNSNHEVALNWIGE